MDEESLLGPVQNQRQWDVVNGLVEAAMDGGANGAAGANPDRDSVRFFYPATIISDIDPHDELVVREQFGPALPVVRYTEIGDALTWANELLEGLGASVWSSDRERELKIAERMEAGTVWINSHGGAHPFVRFGGTKSSGYGVEFVAEGLKFVALPQVING